MDTERIQREYMQTMQEFRKLQMMHKRKTEIFGREFGFLRMIECFQRENPDVPGIYASDLAARTGMTKSGVSKSLHKLEQRGMVARAVDPNDRRNTFVSLAPAGREFCERQHANWRTMIKRVSEDIGEERFLEIMSGVREIMRSMAQELTALEQNQTTEEETRCDPFSEI
ncbi:MAG: MarR family transcriptional regulator [Eubacteriales bacterium]|nr:MarR family transcriptional regulator [Eubacteriales bacterium]